MPSPPSTRLHSINTAPSTGPRPPIRKQAHPPTGKQAHPPARPIQLPIIKKSYTPRPGPSNPQKRAAAQAAAARGVKGKELASLPAEVRKYHTQLAPKVAGGSNVQIGRDGLPQLNAPVQTGTSLVSN